MKFQFQAKFKKKERALFLLRNKKNYKNNKRVLFFAFFWGSFCHLAISISNTLLKRLNNVWRASSRPRSLRRMRSVCLA